MSLLSEEGQGGERRFRAFPASRFQSGCLARRGEAVNKRPVDPEAYTDRLMIGVTPLTPERIKEILRLISRAQTYGKEVALPTDDALAMVAEIRMRRRYAERGKKIDKVD